jgi:hypothetical protein
MTIRKWVLNQLNENIRGLYRRGVRVEAVGEHGVKVLRQGRPDAVGYCVEPDSVDPFTVQALEDAMNELPQTGMVIVTRRIVDPDVYQRAPVLGVCVDTFGGFIRAMDDFDDISEYVHPEESYFRRRLSFTRAVTSLTRRGHRAWELQRINQLRPLTVVTHDRYELTDDGFAEILNQYPKLDLDALVITNSAAQGFGDRVVQSSQRAGVPLYTLNEFIAKIRDPWT